MSGTVSNNRPNPCKGCNDRYPGCQDHCRKPEHQAWMAEQEKIRENRRNYKGSVWSRKESYVRKWK